MRVADHDRCPGVLSPFIAADGTLVRLRFPGGRTSATRLRSLSQVAAAHGSPDLHLTSRGNIQIRALPDPLPPSLSNELAVLAGITHPSHERARNITAGPGSDLDDLITALDEAICVTPELARLPGRFGFALADKSGFGLATSWDLALTADRRTLLVGRYHAMPAEADPVATMITMAQQFLATRPTERVWNIHELPDASSLFNGLAAAPANYMRRRWPQPGRCSDDVSVVADYCVAVPLGLLSPDQTSTLAELEQSGQISGVVILPNRSLVVKNAVVDALTALELSGFATEPGTPASMVTTCTGAPYCVRSRGETVSVARAAITALNGESATRRVHVVGCERQCGATNDAIVMSTPTTSGDVARAMRGATND